MDRAFEFERWVGELLAPKASGGALHVLLEGLVESSFCLEARARRIDLEGGHRLLAEAVLGGEHKGDAEPEPCSVLPPDRRRIEVPVQGGRVVLELWNVTFGAGCESEDLEALLLLALTIDAAHSDTGAGGRPRPWQAVDLREWLESAVEGLEPEVRDALLLALLVDPNQDP